MAALSYFFPAHDEAENIEALVDEALTELGRLAERFEIICVDDGSTDGTGQIADRLAGAHADVVRVVHHPANLGYGSAVRSGLAAARYPLICFTDGDRQFRIADLARLLARLEPTGMGRPRTWWPATASSVPTRPYDSSMRAATGPVCGSSSGCVSRTPTAPASSFGAKSLQRRARGVGWCLPVGRAAHQDR